VQGRSQEFFFLGGYQYGGGQTKRGWEKFREILHALKWCISVHT